MQNIISKKPVYTTNLGQLYHGDCLEIMKEISDRSVDLIVTDPPYGLNYNNNDLVHRRELIFGGKIENMKPNPIAGDSKEEAEKLFTQMLHIAKDKLQKGGACCCFCTGGGPDPTFARWALLMDSIIGFNHVVIWDKGGLGMGIHYRRSYEFILIAQNGNPIHRWNGGNNTSNVWHINKIIPQKDHHPTIKPVSIMAKAIQIYSNPDDLVLDPFIGSGTTAIACEKLGRRWIGIEIEERFIEMAIKRIDQEARQFKLL